MPIHNPPHPGRHPAPGYLARTGISVTELARHIGYARPHLSKVLNGHAPIRAELAVKLERAGIGKAKVWLAVQADYDIWHTEQELQPLIEPIAAHGD
ncbi:addiction module antidote protein, HigA family [Pseudomonas protegens]|nr:addiction module antidote protein, HigA family [Pseudomonas protegens]